MDEAASLVEQAKELSQGISHELTAILEEVSSSLIHSKEHIVREVRAFESSLKQEIHLKLQMKHQRLRERTLAVREERAALRAKEDDLNNEVQQLLNTIDDHNRLNEKLNKHYQKRLAFIERDLKTLYGMVSEFQQPVVHPNTQQPFQFIPASTTSFRNHAQVNSNNSARKTSSSQIMQYPGGPFTARGA